jgi:hypothetical protein
MSRHFQEDPSLSDPLPSPSPLASHSAHLEYSRFVADFYNF